jgi:hypothetical protein
MACYIIFVCITLVSLCVDHFSVIGYVIMACVSMACMYITVALGLVYLYCYVSMSSVDLLL